MNNYKIEINYPLKERTILLQSIELTNQTMIIVAANYKLGIHTNMINIFNPKAQIELIELFKGEKNINDLQKFSDTGYIMFCDKYGKYFKNKRNIITPENATILDNYFAATKSILDNNHKDLIYKRKIKFVDIMKNRKDQKDLLRAKY